MINIYSDPSFWPALPPRVFVILDRLSLLNQKKSNKTAGTEFVKLRDFPPPSMSNRWLAQSFSKQSIQRPTEMYQQSSELAEVNMENVEKTCLTFTIIF